MARVRLPVGYTFAPSDEEFLSFYLKRKATSRRPYQDVVPEFDVFKTVPKKLPSGGRLFLDNKFFFMNLKDRVFENMDKREAGSGYWKAAGPVKNFVVGPNNKVVVGKRHRLVFWRRDKEGDNFVRTRWIMHEFRVFLTDANPTPQISSWAGYKIFLKKARKNKKAKASTGQDYDSDNYNTENEEEEEMEVDADVEAPSVLNFGMENDTKAPPPSPATSSSSDSFISQRRGIQKS